MGFSRVASFAWVSSVEVTASPVCGACGLRPSRAGIHRLCYSPFRHLYGTNQLLTQPPVSRDFQSRARRLQNITPILGAPYWGKRSSVPDVLPTPAHQLPFLQRAQLHHTLPHPPRHFAMVQLRLLATYDASICFPRVRLRRSRRFSTFAINQFVLHPSAPLAAYPIEIAALASSPCNDLAPFACNVRCPRLLCKSHVAPIASAPHLRRLPAR